MTEHVITQSQSYDADAEQWNYSWKCSCGTGDMGALDDYDEAEDEVRQHLTLARQAEEAERLGMPYSDRGFLQGAKFPSTYGGTIRCYESSAASYDALWISVEEVPVDLNQPLGEKKEAQMHMRVEHALGFYQQLGVLLSPYFKPFPAEVLDSKDPCSPSSGVSETSPEIEGSS